MFVGKRHPVFEHTLAPMKYAWGSKRIIVRCKCGRIIAEYVPGEAGERERVLAAFEYHQKDVSAEQGQLPIEFPCSSHP